MADLKVGQRVRLLEMPHDPNPVPEGSEGTIIRVGIGTKTRQISVAWDNGRSLAMLEDVDRFVVINDD